jgi:uncharacterized protein YkwD
MRKLGLLALALSLGACASSGTLEAQGSRNSLEAEGPRNSEYGNYWTTSYSYGLTRTRDAPPEAPRGEASAALAAQVLAEINRVRTDPQHYAERLRTYRTYYHGDVMRAPGDEVGVRTHEGVAALDEAIADVARRKPLKPLAPNARLRASAARLAEEEGPTGVVGHVGPDGLTPGQRMREAGVWAGITEENISFGQATAAAVVRQLIIDDGVPGRGHRSSLFERGVTAAGVSCGPHSRYGWMCVIDLAGAFVRG